MHIFILLLIPFLAYGNSEIEDAKRSIQSLIRPLLNGGGQARPKGAEKFRVDTCEKEKINWMDVLFMRKEATLTYTFKEGCDIQGTITPKVFQPFPAKLALRHIDSYQEVQGQNRIMAQLESKPILNLEIREGLLTGKHKVKFEADYKVQINPMEKNPVEKNLGGVLRILELNGKKVNITEKILVK